MPNVLDAEPLRAFVKRAGAKIADEKVAARFERLALAQLMNDSRNFRLAAAPDFDGAPAWALEARARGEAISVFKLHRGAAQRLHNVARRLADTCRIAAADCAARPHDASTISAARAFLDKIERASFDVAARKTLYFARVFAIWSDDRDAEQVCGDQTVAANHGRVWVRVTSVAGLRAAGREFRNCLARTTRSSSYGGGLCRGLTQFWVLRDAKGAGLIIAMADAPNATAFYDVRGPRNTPIYAEHVDLVRLAIALGLRPNSPPPPPSGAAAVVLLARSPCLCIACNPTFLRTAAPLRPRAAAP